MSELTATQRLAQVREALDSTRRRRNEIQRQLSQARSLAGPSVLVTGAPDHETTLRRELRDLHSAIDYLETAAQTAQQAWEREQAASTALPPATNPLELFEWQRAAACLDFVDGVPGAEGRLIAIENKIATVRLYQERLALAAEERRRRAEQVHRPE